MRIVHISDIHFADKHLAEVQRCARFATTWMAEQVGPDLIVLTGDIFDHRLEQTSPAFLEAVRWVACLGNFAPVLVLQGTYSHDAPGAVSVFRHVHTSYPVYVADRIEQVAFRLESPYFSPLSGDMTFIDRDSALLSCLPAVNKGQVAAAVGAENAATAAGEAVAQLLASWAPSHRAARKAGVPSIVLSHGTVSGSVTEHGVPMAGLDHEFTTGALFAADATAVMVGHIHKHQAWEQGGHGIAYPGSIARLHFGEFDPKGFLLWELEADAATWELIETPARRLVDVDFAGAAPDMDELRGFADNCGDDAHVRIRYAVDEEHRHSIDKAAIEAMFAHAAGVKIEAQILPVQRQRAAGITRALSVADMVQRWGEVTGTDTAPLLPRVHALEERTDPTELLEEFTA